MQTFSNLDTNCTNQFLSMPSFIKHVASLCEITITSIHLKYSKWIRNNCSKEESCHPGDTTRTLRNQDSWSWISSWPEYNLLHLFETKIWQLCHDDFSQITGKPLSNIWAHWADTSFPKQKEYSALIPMRYFLSWRGLCHGNGYFFIDLKIQQVAAVVLVYTTILHIMMAWVILL